MPWLERKGQQKYLFISLNNIGKCLPWKAAATSNLRLNRFLDRL